MEGIGKSEEGYPEFAPTFSADIHFANVKGFRDLDFDAERCAELFTHPNIGIAEEDLSRIHINLRPDYKLGYSKKERRAIKAEDPDEYDTEHASCESIEEGDDSSKFGNQGDVLMTIVSDTKYEEDDLLRHEGVHAEEMLKKRNFFAQKARDFASPILDYFEERRADDAMEDPELSELGKDIITVNFDNKKGKKA